MTPSRWLVVTVAALALAAAVGLASGASAEDGGIRLSGTVLDASTGEAIPNASVEVADTTTSYPGRVVWETATNASGGFQLEVGSRRIGMSLNHPDYAGAGFGFAVLEGEKRPSITIHLPEPRSPTVNLSGVVRGSDGDPIEGASVRVAPIADNPHPNLPKPSGQGVDVDAGAHLRLHAGNAPNGHTETDDEGRWSMAVNPGGARLSVDADLYEPSSRKLVLEEGSRHVETVLTSSSPGALDVNGTVLDARTGEPVPHARITYQPHPLAPTQRELADEEGDFAFPVRPRYGVLSVTGPEESGERDYANVSRFYESREEEPLDTTIELPRLDGRDADPGTTVNLEAYVLGPYGHRPIPGAMVEASEQTTDATECIVVGNEASLSLTGPPGVYDFEITTRSTVTTNLTVDVTGDRTEPIGLRAFPPKGPSAEGLECPPPGNSTRSLALEEAELGEFEPGEAVEPATIGPAEAEQSTVSVAAGIGLLAAALGAALARRSHREG